MFCDGSRRGRDLVAGFACIVMEGNIVKAVETNWCSSCQSALRSECEAIRLGLGMAEKLKAARASICSDSNKAIWAVRGKCDVQAACGEVIAACSRLLTNSASWS